MNDNYKIICYKSENWPVEVLKSTAAFYTYIFNNSSDHFFIHRKTGQTLGRKDIPELVNNEDSYLSNEILQKLYREIYDAKGYTLWHQEEIVYKNIQRKLKRDGILVLLIDTSSADEIKGFSFGRRCKLNEALETEEWINPYLYSELSQNADFNRNKDFIVSKINDYIHSVATETYKYQEVTLDTPIYCWNAAGLDPELQGRGYMKKVNDMYFGNIPKEYGDLLLLGEATAKRDHLTSRKKRSNLENFERVGAKKIMKMSEDLYLIGVPVEKFVTGFMGHKPKNMKITL